MSLIILDVFTKRCKPMDIHVMQSQGFTVREIEILTGISKSQVSRELKED